MIVLSEEEGLPAGARIGLVQTVDFFPPVVDDPTLYGEIAAANALSDVYAMGGRPFSVLTLAGFPKDFDPSWRDAILLGGFDKVREAGAIVAGGHTVESEVQFGYSVTGLIDPENIKTNGGAKAGDVAYLTKPIGMGCMTTAAKFELISWETMKPAALQMATLNDRAGRAMAKVDAHACTDITGFGLIGHSMNIARASELTFQLEAAAVPLFQDVIELARKESFSGGARRGLAALGDDVSFADGIEDAIRGLLFDAETSGGLMIVIPETESTRLEDALRAEDLPVHRIGEFKPRGEHSIAVV